MPKLGKPHKAFFISQVGDRSSPERKRADEVFDHIVIPVANEFNLDVLRADRDPTPGQITSQMVRALLESKVGICRSNRT